MFFYCNESKIKSVTKKMEKSNDSRQEHPLNRPLIQQCTITSFVFNGTQTKIAFKLNVHFCNLNAKWMFGSSFRFGYSWNKKVFLEHFRSTHLIFSFRSVFTFYSVVVQMLNINRFEISVHQNVSSITKWICIFSFELSTFTVFKL